MSHAHFQIGSLQRVLATCAVVLSFGVTPAAAQKADPMDMTASSETEMRRRMEPLVPSIRAALQGDNVDSQRAALAIVADFPPGLSAEANLADALAAFLQRDLKDPVVIALGLRSFGRSGPNPADINKVVSRHTKSEHTIVRRAAAESLSTAINGSPTGPTVANATRFIDVARQSFPLLTEQLTDSDEAVQRTALEGFQSAARMLRGLYKYDTGALDEPKLKDKETRFAPLAPVLKDISAAIPKLTTPMSGAEASTRIAAARTIQALAELRREMIAATGSGAGALAEGWLVLRPSVMARMKDESADVRLAMTEGLESLGDALEAREVLREATLDPVVFVRWAAARSLGNTPPAKADPGAVEADAASLGRLVFDTDVDVRIAALTAISRLGPSLKSVAPVVLAAAGRGDVEPRVAAIKALAHLETSAESTVPVLIAALAQRDLRLRTAAASGLVRFGPDARPALPELRKAVINPDLDLRLAAAEAILAIDRKPRLRDL